jgi:hypothetical protein
MLRLAMSGDAIAGPLAPSTVGVEEGASPRAVGAAAGRKAAAAAASDLPGVMRFGFAAGIDTLRLPLRGADALLTGASASMQLVPRAEGGDAVAGAGLEAAEGAPLRYDVVWLQWVVGCATDCDLVRFLRQVVETSLAPGGVVVVKDNVCRPDAAFYYDRTDHSCTRSEAYLRLLWAAAGLVCVVRQWPRRPPPPAVHPLSPADPAAGESPVAPPVVGRADVVPASDGGTWTDDDWVWDDDAMMPIGVWVLRPAPPRPRPVDVLSARLAELGATAGAVSSRGAVGVSGRERARGGGPSSDDDDDVCAVAARSPARRRGGAKGSKR